MTNDYLGDKFIEFMESQGFKFVDTESQVAKKTVGKKLKKCSGRISDRGGADERKCREKSSHNL